MPDYVQPGMSGGNGGFSYGPPQFSQQLAALSTGYRATQPSSSDGSTRPFADVGKSTINMLDPNAPDEPKLAETGGFFTGLLGAIGNTFGDPGRSVGELLGHVIEAPLGVLGSGMSTLGGVGIHVGAPGGTYGSVIDSASPVNKQGDLTVGSVVGGLLGSFGLLGTAVQRAYAGSSFRGSFAPDIEQQIVAGKLTREQAADISVERGQGFSNDMVHNIGLSILLDPLTWLTLGVGGVAKGASAVTKVAGAVEKTADVGRMGELLSLGGGKFTAASARAAIAAGDSVPLRLGRLEALGLSTFGSVSTLTPDSAVVRVANQITRITDPLKFFGGGDIGKRTTDHVMAAATEGVVAAYKPGVVMSVERAFDSISPEAGQRLDKAIATGVTNITNRVIADEAIGDAIRDAGSAAGAKVNLVIGREGIGLTPNELARATISNKGVDASLGRIIEVVAEKVKPMLAHLSPEALRSETVAKAARIAGVSVEEMDRVMGHVGYDEAALVHLAFYNHMGAELIDEVVPAIRNGFHVLPKDVIPERLTLIGERTLTTVRRDELLRAVNVGDATTVRRLVARLEEFDWLNEKAITTDEDKQLLQVVGDWLKANGDTAITEVPLRPELPAVLRHWMEDADAFGYRLGLTPTGTPEQLFRISRDAEGRLVQARPWLDFVSEGSTFIRPNRLQAARMQAFRQIRAEQIVWRNRRTFVRNLSANHGIAQGTAERMFRTIVYEGTERGVAPRGLNPREIMDAARKAINDEAKLGGSMQRLTERELTRELLIAFKGDFSQVGVTQAITGAAKVRLPGAGANYWGQLSEKLYPLMKFTLSPWFMLQEYIEPYVLAAMRGIWVPLRTNSKGFKEALAMRQALAQFLRNDLGEDGALMEMAEYQKMLSGTYSVIHERLGTLGKMADGVWGNIGLRKEVAAALQTKRVFGSRLKETFTEIRGPQYWGELERHYGTTDAGEIAMRWMSENFQLRDANGEKIEAFVDLLNPINVGAETRLARGTGQGVRWHHLADFLDWHDDDYGETLIANLKAGHQATLKGEALTGDAISLDTFMRRGLDKGLDETFLKRSWQAATGPTADEFWTGYRKAYLYKTVPGDVAKKAEVEAARALVQVRAASMGVSEDYYVATHFGDVPFRQAGTEANLQGAQALFEIREGLFGPTGYFAQQHGGSLEEATIAAGLAGAETPYVHHGTLPSLARSIEATGMHPGSNWTKDVDEALKYAYGSEKPIFRSRQAFVGGMATDNKVVEGTYVAPRYLEVSRDGGQTWVRVTTKQPVFMRLPVEPPKFRVEVGRAFLGENAGVAEHAVMDEFDEASQAAHLFNEMAMNNPDELRAALRDGRIDPKHAKAVENAIETAQAQRPRPLVEFTRADGSIERYGMVEPQHLVEQNLQWMLPNDGLAAGRWYPDIRNRFERLFGADTDAVMLAFAVSQASAAPTNGMKNVLHVIEQLFADGFEARVLDASRDASQKNPIRLMASVREIVGEENWKRLRISARSRQRALEEAARTGGVAAVKLTGELNEENIVKALLGMKINGSFGPKLNDFLDSLLGNTTRRWVGRAGGMAPVAVDRWTARDVGFLDGTTLDYLVGRYGRDAGNGVTEVMSKEGGEGHVVWTMAKGPGDKWVYVDRGGNYVDREGNLLTDAEGKLLDGKKPVPVADFDGAPEEYAYEHGVRVINEATRLFNEYVSPKTNVQGVWGKTDWTPADVQAVGWIRMQKVMGGAEEAPFETFGQNTFTSFFSAAPEAGTDLADRANVVARLAPEDRMYVTRELASRLGSDAREDWGITTVVSNEAHFGERIDTSIPRNRQIEVHVRTPEGWSRGRVVPPDELARLRLEGAKTVAEALSGGKQPIATTADEIATTLQDRVATAWNGSEDWGGGTFNPITGNWVTPEDGRFVAGIGQTIRLTAEQAQDPEVFKAAIQRALDDPQMGHEGVVIGVFNDKDAGNVVDIDVALMVKGTERNAEGVQAYLGRLGGAYDYDTGDGVFQPLVKQAGITSPMAVLSTPNSAMDMNDRLAIATRTRQTLPIRTSASGFKETLHRPVVDLHFPAVANDQHAIDALGAVVNALRDEQELLPPGLRRSFEYNIWRDEAGKLVLRIVDDADPEVAYFARRTVAGQGAAESKGMLDPELLRERMTRAMKVAGLDPKEEIAKADVDFFHAELYRSEPIVTARTRQASDPAARRAIQAAYDAGDTELGQRLQREAMERPGAIPGFGVPPEEIGADERAQIEGYLQRFRDRGRPDITEGDIRRWRDAYAEHLDALLAERAPENYGRALRGEPLLERRTGAALGFTQRTYDGRAVIGAFKNADPVTGLHELAHVFATDLDESARRIVMDARATSLATRRTDLNARIAVLDAKLAAGGARTSVGRWSRQRTALAHDLGEIADETTWGVEHEEYVVSEFQKWIKTGVAPNPKLEGVFQHFKNWLDRTWQAIKGQRGMEGERPSPAMEALFNEMFSGKPPVESVGYDLDQHVLRMAAKQQLRLSQDEAFATQYFKMGRSWFERSLNHPFLGLYPLSYMWGKIMPEMFRFLALRPFGLTAPMVMWNALGQVSDSVTAQQQMDPAFREFMTNNADAFSTINALFPALPNDIPATAPLWARRIAEQGLENSAAVKRGEKVHNVDLMKGLGDQVTYMFGPAQSLQRGTSLASSIGDEARNMLGMPQPDPKKEAARRKKLLAAQAAAQAAQNALNTTP